MLIKGNVLKNNGVIKYSEYRINKGIIISEGLGLKHLNNEQVILLKNYELVTSPLYDSHVHLRDSNEKDRETIYSGTMHLKKTGCFGCAAMPNTNPSLTTAKLVKDYKKIIKESAQIPVDLYGLITPNSTKEQLKKLGKETINKFKIFQGKSTGIASTMFDNNDKLLEQILLLPEGSEVRVHCEDPNLIDEYEKKYPFDPNNAITHYYARSNLVEKKGIGFLVNDDNLPKILNKEIKLVICHLSTKEGLNLIRKARNKYGRDAVKCETAYHYLYFNNQDFANKGVLLKCNPSVKTEDDRLELILALVDGEIDYLVSDHAPHTEFDKLKKYFSGLPSFDVGIYGWIINQSIHNIEGLANITKAASLTLKPEWEIKVGNKANMIIINTKGKIVTSKDQETKAKNLSPYNDELLPYLSGYVNENLAVFF
jgi:dihydroorotase